MPLLLLRACIGTPAAEARLFLIPTGQWQWQLEQQTWHGS